MTNVAKEQGARPVDALASSFAAIFGGAQAAGITASLASALQTNQAEVHEVPEFSEVATVDEVDDRNRFSSPRG